MKKFLFILCFLFIPFVGVSAYEYNTRYLDNTGVYYISTDRGNVVLDLDYLFTQYETNGQFVLYKNTNNQVCLFLNGKYKADLFFDYAQANSVHSFVFNSLGQYGSDNNIKNFVYNFNTNQFELTDRAWVSYDLYDNNIYYSSEKYFYNRFYSKQGEFVQQSDWLYSMQLYNDTTWQLNKSMFDLSMSSNVDDLMNIKEQYSIFNSSPFTYTRDSLNRSLTAIDNLFKDTALDYIVLFQMGYSDFPNNQSFQVIYYPHADETHSNQIRFRYGYNNSTSDTRKFLLTADLYSVGGASSVCSFNVGVLSNSSLPSELPTDSCFTWKQINLFTNYNYGLTSGYSSVIVGGNVEEFTFTNIGINIPNNLNFLLKDGRTESIALDGSYIYKRNTILNGFIDNFGDDNFGINSRGVTINSGIGSTNKIFNSITCETDRPFNENDVCIVNNDDLIYDTDDILNTSFSFDIRFSENNDSIPLQANKYYLLNYRVYFDTSLIPTNLYIRSGTSTIPTNIIATDVKEHGVYKDYIITFTTPAASTDIAVTGFYILLPNLNTIMSSFPNNFNLGVYRTFKYKQFDNQPTTYDIDNFYNNNSLDSIANGSSYNFFNNFNINDHGLTTLIKKPLEILDHVVTQACTPIQIPFPHSNEVVTLPCLQSVLSEKLGILFTIIQTILSGLVCYRVALGVFNTIKDLINPKNDKVEVIDL